MANDEDRLKEILDMLREQLESQRRIEASLCEWVKNYKSISWAGFAFGVLFMVLFTAYMVWQTVN